MTEQLPDMEERFRLLIENVEDHGIFMMDAEGRIVSWNIGAERIFGYQEAEIIGQPFARLFPPEQSAEAELELIRAKTEGRASDDRWHVRKDRTRFWCNGVSTALRDSAGNLKGFAKVLRDLTHEKGMDEALQDALTYADSIIATLREPFVVLDKSLQIKTANRSFYRTFQVAQEETEGRFIYHLGNGQWNIPGLRTLLEEVLPQNHSFQDFVVEHDFPALGKKIMLLNAHRFVSVDSRPDLILLAIEDITERKQAEVAVRTSEMRYRRLFQTAQDGILILDANTLKIIDANPFMTEMLGYAPDEFLGKELWEIGLFGDKLASQAVYQELQEKGYIRYDNLPLETKNGKRAEVEFVSNVYQVDQRLVAQCNIRDIGERSRLNQKLREQAEALVDLHRRKDEFLAMLSHELRNPLAPLANAVHLLRLQKSEDQVQQQARTIIERQVSQLTRLVDDLMEVSRITTGRVQLRQDRVVVSGIVERALETARPLVDERRHELTVVLPPQPIWLYADAARLEQVVVNLLTNAAKYTDECGRIRLTVQQEGDECVMRVRDTGVGIAPELLPRIFDLFTQAERSLDRSQGGLGIGLALVQRLVEMHRGRVEVSSVLGQGSEFVVRLPVLLTPSPQPPSTPEKTAEPFGPALRVLVVDDNADTAESMAMLLRASGHEVRTAYSGPDTIEAAAAWPPSVVLLDIGLPGMDGYQVARRLRQEPQLKDVRLIAITGYGQEGDIQHSHEAGFDAHLVKPVELRKVQELLLALAR